MTQCTVGTMGLPRRNVGVPVMDVACKNRMYLVCHTASIKEVNLNQSTHYQSHQQSQILGYELAYNTLHGVAGNHRCYVL